MNFGVWRGKQGGKGQGREGQRTGRKEGVNVKYINIPTTEKSSSGRSSSTSSKYLY